MPPTLSKSTFIRGSQCKKSLYFNTHSPELKDKITPMQQAIFRQGHEVGRLARQLFPGGINAGIFFTDSYEGSIKMTSSLIHFGAKVLYEAGFSINGMHCFVDILIQDKEGWKAYEVKSSTQVKPVNVLDAAFQYYVMNLCGLQLSDISLIVLNTSYNRSGPLDLHKLFKVESVHNQVIQLQNQVQNDVREFFRILNEPTAPMVDIGPHCSDPFDCDFHSQCWQHVPEYSIFDISRLSGEKKWELYNKGVLKFEDIPPDFNLNESQWQQVLAELKGEFHIDKAGIKQFIGSLTYPLYFLDFESFQPAIPMFDNSRPYQQIVFQYSLHRRMKKDSPLEHWSFLAKNDGSDPRIPFIHQLIEDIGRTGDILVFNRAFESACLNDIAASFPIFQPAISNIVSRMKDLMVIFQQRLYYVPEMKGSYSIKQVLPALVPGFNYESLTINNGGAASHAFMSLVSENDKIMIQSTRENLLEYCRQDTLAMVEILRVLQGIIE
jgi:hypothetical protein